MAKSKMVNFRMTETDLDLIDQLARVQGVTRSDWIKQAITLSMGHSKSQTKRVAVQAAAAPTVLCKFPNQKPCPANVVRLATGVKQCQTCGMKKA